MLCLLQEALSEIKMFFLAFEARFIERTIQHEAA